MRPTSITLTAVATLTLLGALSPCARAQAPPDVQKQRQEMRKLGFLVGRWEGEGWYQMGPDEREEFLQTEEVVWKLDSLVIQIDGLGVSKKPDGSAGEVAMKAFGVISYDMAGARHRFMAYTSEGKVADAVATVGERSLSWSFGVPGGLTIRYTMTFDEEGLWRETGEFSRDRVTWTQFLDMTLRRVS
jgi:hypothetical protein